MESRKKTFTKSKSTLISTEALSGINHIINENNNRILCGSAESDDANKKTKTQATLQRPKSALLRGVKVTNLNESRLNPEPIFIDNDDDFLGNYLSPYKLQALTGETDLKKVSYLELKVNTNDMTINNMGSYLPNLKRLRFSESTVHTVRDLGSNLRHLSVLWLSRCGLKDLDGMSSLTSLSELYLSYNQLTDISSCSLLPHLSVLDLESNHLDDVEQLSFLSFCQNLWNLTLRGNPLCTQSEDSTKPSGASDYRTVVAENVGDQLKLLDGLSLDCSADHTLHKLHESHSGVELAGGKCGRKDGGKDEQTTEAADSASELVSKGHVMCGSIAKVLKSCRTPRSQRESNVEPLDLQESFDEALDNMTSLHEEIKTMRVDLEKSLGEMSLRRRPNVLKVASRDDAEAGDEVTEAGEKTNSKPNDKIRSVKGTDRIFSPSIVNDGGVHDQDRNEPRTYNATNKQTVAMAESKTDKQADNKADKQADNKADKQADNKADKQADNKTDKQADNKTDKQANNKADKQADNKADKQADNKADKQADNKADKQADNKADKQADNKADKQADNKVDKVVDNRTDKEGDLIEQGSTSNVLGGESEDDRGGVVDGGAGRTRVRITADNYEEVLQRLSKEEDQCMEDKRRKIDETIDFFAELARNPLDLGHPKVSEDAGGEGGKASSYGHFAHLPKLQAPASLTSLPLPFSQADLNFVPSGSTVKACKGKKSSAKKQVGFNNTVSDRSERLRCNIELPTVKTHLKSVIDTEGVRKKEEGSLARGGSKKTKKEKKKKDEAEVMKSANLLLKTSLASAKQSLHTSIV